jgi:type IV pilus assembly protein PilM
VGRMRIEGLIRRAAGAKLSAVPGWSALRAGSEQFLAGPWQDLVGIDLSPDAVQVAHLVRRGKRVVRFDSAHRPLRASDVKPAEQRFAHQAALRDVVQKLGLRGKPAAASLQGSEIHVRRLSLPLVKRSEILPALALECRKHVSFPIEDAEIRYEILNRNAATAATGLQLLVAVAHRRAVEETRDAMEAAGLRPVALTARPVGLRALLRSTERTQSDAVVAYLELGERQSQIIVFRGDEVRFTREFEFGGATLTEALRSIVVPGQGTIELTEKEAEELKRTSGIPYGDEESGTAGSIPLSAVSVMLRPVLERLVRELLNSFDYCNEQFLGQAVTRVVLHGAGAQVRNLPAYLSGILEIPVERADLSDEALALSPRPDAEPGVGRRVSELAVGLCMLGRGSLNFLEPATAGVSYRIAESIPQRVAIGVAAVLLMSVSLPAEVTVMRQRQEVGRLQSALISLEPRTDALRRFRAAREEETRLQDLLARLSGGQVLWSFVLRDLSHRIGPNARLTAIEVVDPVPAANAQQGTEPRYRRLRLSGLLRTGAERPEKGLGELMQVLAQSRVVEQVQLEGCQAVSAAMSSFTLTAVLPE